MKSYVKCIRMLSAGLLLVGSVQASVLIDRDPSKPLQVEKNIFEKPSMRNPAMDHMESDGGFLRPGNSRNLYDIMDVMNESSAKNRVDELNQALQEESYHEALILIRKLKGVQFSQDDRLFWEASILRSLERLDEAEALLASRNMEGKSKASQFVLLMGLVQMEQEKWVDARETLLPLATRSLPLNNLLVEVISKANSAPDPIDLGDLLLNPLSYDVDVNALYNAAVLLFDMGEYEAAMEKARRGVKKDSQHAGSQYMLGSSLLALQRYDEASEALLSCLRIEPDHAKAFGNLSMISYEQGEISQALSRMITALGLDVTYAKGWSNYLFMLSNELVAREGLEPLPDPAEGSEDAVSVWHWQAALKAMEASDFPLSTRHFLKSLSVDLNDPNVHNDFAALLYRADRKALAIPFLRAAATLSPDSTLVQDNLQAVLNEVEQDALNQQVERILEDIVAEDTAVHRTALARAYQGLDRKEESLEQYRIAFELEPEIVGYRINLAQSLANSEKYKESIDVFQPVLKKLPENPRMKARMAWLLLQQENPDWRDRELAVQLARETCEMTDYQDFGFLRLLMRAFTVNDEVDKAEKIQKKIDVLTEQKSDAQEIEEPSS